MMLPIHVFLLLTSRATKEHAPEAAQRTRCLRRRIWSRSAPDRNARSVIDDGLLSCAANTTAAHSFAHRIGTFMFFLSYAPLH